MSFAIIPGNLSIIWWIYTVNLSDSHICFSRYELYPGYDSCFSQILTAGDSTMKKRYGGMAGVKPIYQVVGGDPPVPLHLGKPWLVLYFHWRQSLYSSDMKLWTKYMFHGKNDMFHIIVCFPNCERNQHFELLNQYQC